ncbi:MAG TPA: ATPase, T2SS/T4P/T4SS family, partial [Burkholderiales bacterium]|nr:ATPase, T2SS/T4P/T4SS family [Burkholderiales bacterium]
MSADPNATGSQSLAGTQANAGYVPKRIDAYLREVLSHNGSDLHFVAGDPPRIRLYGELNTLRDEKLGQDQVREALFEIMPRTATTRFEQKDGADFAYSIPGVSRFRVNVFRHIGGMGGVFRAIPSRALTLDQLNMPDAVRGLCRVNSGLILVTGKTGSGKSTSLAAMIDD